MSTAPKLTKKMRQEIFDAAWGSINKPGGVSSDLPKQESDRYPEIYVFRHGETYDNRNKRFSGWRNAKLTPRGKKQAEILGKKLKDAHIDICITSDLQRAQETAKIVFKHHKGIKFEVDPRIKERSYGDLQGKSKDKLMREDPEKAMMYRRGYDVPPPKGESMKMVEERVFPFCAELVERVRQNNVNVAVSCHGNSMRAIRRFFEHMSLIETLTHENPLAQDYAQYVIKR